MSRKNRTTKDNIGIVYLFTNELYERENLYKYGITINPFQRKRVQSNSTPPNYRFYDRIIIFSKSYKEIEKQLTKIFKEKDILQRGEDEGPSGTRGGQEWIKADLSLIVVIFKDILKIYPDAEMCYKGKRYIYENGIERELKLPPCRLDLLGILNGDTIKYIENGKYYQVQNNKIIVGGVEMTLSGFVKTQKKREGNTNEYNGYMYFTYKGHKTTLYDMWQSLVIGKEKRQ
ncbi:MAG: GIY-YIG nuclease family protein [Bacteroidaceae bacterium]|nr:GIY-YIG nuclease family protein [Bacteroidaceae bacterium]